MIKPFKHTGRLSAMLALNAVILAGDIGNAQASGLFRSGSGSICEQAEAAGIDPIRRTLVYVDKQSLSLSSDEQGWFSALNQALQQTMTTAEPLEIIVLDSADGTAKAHGPGLCYPVIEERYHGRFANSGISGLLTNDLIDQLPDLQQEIVVQMQDMVVPEYADAPETRRQMAAEQVEQRHLLRALQSDSARFVSDTPSRVILYSDMLENSDLAELPAILNGSDEDRLTLASDALESLPRLDFQGAMVYGFGTGQSLDDPAATDALSEFMQQAVYQANGYPIAFSRELAVRPIRPSMSNSYDMTIKVENRELKGRMQLMSDADGRLVDSYLDLGAGNRSSHFDSGRLICSQDDQCQLEGKLATALLFEDPENVFLEGSRETLSGHLGFRNDRLADSDNPALLPLDAESRP
ncbi:hypothetical protein FIU88_00405 [Halomonas sp. THAF12]|uniref:hypothetical protein n=1 Tax=Halomonas sp. THAF12 TaxID=2587849 RepID=UPI001267DBB4|nr:hypothetical protein [Halomonas sp. THAF12]QFT83425.1 hypothetical protein FIU88_00405 [Halomonas sp. THAF12]